MPPKDALALAKEAALAKAMRRKENGEKKPEEKKAEKKKEETPTGKVVAVAEGNGQRPDESAFLAESSNKVERHDDKIICQIKDAHFVMDKQLVVRDYKNHPWFENGMAWDNEFGDAVYFVVYGDEKYTCHQVNHFCLRSEELKALNSFYAGKDTTLYDVLTSVGAVFPAKTAGQHYQMLLSGDGSIVPDEYNDYFIRATHSVNASEDLTDREYVTIGSAWLERYGFLWMLTRFARWSSYDDSKCWVRTNITERY